MVVDAVDDGNNIYGFVHAYRFVHAYGVINACISTDSKNVATKKLN